MWPIGAGVQVPQPPLSIQIYPLRSQKFKSFPGFEWPGWQNVEWLQYLNTYLENELRRPAGLSWKQLVRWNGLGSTPTFSAYLLVKNRVTSSIWVRVLDSFPYGFESRSWSLCTEVVKLVYTGLCLIFFIRLFRKFYIWSGARVRLMRVVCKTIGRNSRVGSNPTLASKLSGVYKSYFNSFLIKWFNAIFSELIPRFESERNCILYFYRCSDN